MPQYRPQSARYADGGWTGKDLNRVNILPPSQDELRTQYPALYGALAGLMTTAPDQMAGSVLEPGYADRKAGAEKTFTLGSLLQMLPLARGVAGRAATLSSSPAAGSRAAQRGAVTWHGLKTIPNELGGHLSTPVDMPTAINKAGSNVLFGGAKNISQLPVPDTGIVKDFGSLDVKGRTDMLSMMRGLLNNREVLDSVVGLNPIKMVDVFGSKQVTPDMLRHNPSMLIDLLPVNGNHSVPGGVEAINELASRVAQVTAKDPALSSSNAGRLFLERCSTGRADKGSSHVGNILSNPLNSNEHLLKILERNGVPIATPVQQEALKAANKVEQQIPDYLPSTKSKGVDGALFKGYQGETYYEPPDVRMEKLKRLYGAFGSKDPTTYDGGMSPTMARRLYEKGLLKATPKETKLLLDMTDSQGNIRPQIEVPASDINTSNAEYLRQLDRDPKKWQYASGVREPSKHIYPQDKALATAQRNAAKPVSDGGLGLGPKNTPMERAKAMGYPMDMYESGHSPIGLLNNLEKPSSPKKKAEILKAEIESMGIPVKGEQAGTGSTYLTIPGNPYPVDPKYGGGFSVPDEQIRFSTHSTWLDRGVPLNAPSDSYLADVFPKNGNSMEEAKAALKKLIDRGGIRSRFAVFDPARRDSPDLLAGALPALPALALDQEDALKQYSGYAKGGRVTVCNTGGKSTAIHINQPFVRIKGFDDKGA